MVRGKTPKDVEDILPELKQRYEEGEDMEVLASDYGLPKSTIYNYMKELGAVRPKTRGIGKQGRAATAESVIVQKERELNKSEAEKLMTMIIGVGGPIARRYMPLLDRMMQEGKPPEAIAEEIMSWYERKNSVLANMEELQIQITKLEDELGTAYAVAQPNFKYLLKLRTLEKYALQALRLRVAGFKVPVRTLLRAFQNDMEMIDRDMEEALEIKTVEAVVPVE